MDFEVWLSGLLKYCGFNVSRELFQSLLYENERVRPEKEDINKHIRKGQIGDYKEKLKKETIEYLDKKFSSILVKYKYS